MPGKFIVFDGSDRALLEQYKAALLRGLRERGLAAVGTHEPSDGPVGGQVRQVLAGRITVAALPVPLLFLADRIDHLQKEGDGILALLAAGKWVVCTRYLLSALAYQADVAPVDWLARINRPCPWPDAMVWCDSAIDSPLHPRFAAAVEFYRREGRATAVLTLHSTRAVAAACDALLAGEVV